MMSMNHHVKIVWLQEIDKQIVMFQLKELLKEIIKMMKYIKVEVKIILKVDMDLI